MSKRDTFKYELKNGNKVVYVGITNDPEVREKQHQKDGKKFGHMKVIGRATTEDGAKKWESKRLETYRGTHKGKNPKYNKTDNG